MASPSILNRRTLGHRLKESVPAYLFLLPAFCFFAVFVLVPMVRGLVISLFQIEGRTYSFVGFENYQHLFTDPIFAKGLANTLLLVLGNVPLVLILGLFISVNVYKKRPGVRALYRGIFYLPAVASIVSITVVWGWIYHPSFGVLNYFLDVLHLPTVAWLGDPRFALMAVMVIMITLNLGQPIILYIASLGNIPASYLEAAEIDGAGSWQRFLHITWPMLLPTTLYIVIITTINSFQVFAIIQLLTAGGPYYATTTIMYQVYERAFQIGNFGESAAMGILLALIVIAFSVVQYKFLNSDVEY